MEFNETVRDSLVIHDIADLLLCLPFEWRETYCFSLFLLLLLLSEACLDHSFFVFPEIKKQLFDLEVKGQGPTKVITVRDIPPYGHAPTYQI
jgi:hypothetical protein